MRALCVALALPKGPTYCSNKKLTQFNLQLCDVNKLDESLQRLGVMLLPPLEEDAPPP